MKKFIMLSSLLTLLAGVGACSSPKEKYREAKSDAKEEYKEDMKQAEEDYKEDNKDEAEDLIEDSDSVKINDEGDKIKLED